MPALGALRWVLLSTLLLAGTWSNPGQDPAGHLVDGIVGGSVSLTAVIPPGKAVAKIEWEFCLENESWHAIADVINGSWVRPNSSDRFQQRLEIANETTLRIKDLQKQDSGNYSAHITFRNGEGQSQTFHLKVADPNQASTVEEGLNTRKTSVVEDKPVEITARATAGIIIGAVILVIFFIILACFLYRRLKGSRKDVTLRRKYTKVKMEDQEPLTQHTESE